MQIQKSQSPEDTILKIEDLRVEFDSAPPVIAVDGVDLEIRAGQIVGLVGESGSGKTVLSLSILRLLTEAASIRQGAILWRGKNLLELNREQMRRVRGAEIAMIFQNPQASLNPMRKIGSQITSVLQLGRRVSTHDARSEALRLLREVQITDPERVYVSYPHELSGGMCQRVMIAMALSFHPALLIADEPTASLDVTIQAQIMDLLLDLRERFNMSILLVSHDLGVIARMCDWIAVMYRGRIVEAGDAISLYETPKHPYTQALLRSVPVPDPRRRERLQILPVDTGQTSTSLNGGCRFRPRCPIPLEDCAIVDPALIGSDEHHLVACINSRSGDSFFPEKTTKNGDDN
jgi:oligopeptide/dipeptide ABC transporter ATP-binding protein